MLLEKLYFKKDGYDYSVEIHREKNLMFTCSINKIIGNIEITEYTIIDFNFKNIRSYILKYISV